MWLRVFVVSFCLAARVSYAQFDTGGSVRLMIQNLDPVLHDPIGHRVQVPFGQQLALRLVDLASPGRPFVLGVGTNIFAGDLITPWGGSIDILNPVILINGLNPQSGFDLLAHTDFTTSFPVPRQYFCDDRIGPSFQAVHVEASQPPFMLDNTNSGIAYFSSRTATLYGQIGDDAFESHALCVPVMFGGQIYDDMSVGANGTVVFSTGSGDMSPSLQEFFAGFQTPPTLAPRPGVAVFWGDFARPNVFNDEILVSEDHTANTVLVEWRNQVWWSSAAPAGNWSVAFGTLGPGSMVLDLSGVLPGSTSGASSDVDPIVGVSDGSSQNTGLDFVIDFSTATNGTPFQAPQGVGSVSLAQQFAQAGSSVNEPFDLMVLHFLDPTGQLQWTVF